MQHPPSARRRFRKRLSVVTWTPYDFYWHKSTDVQHADLLHCAAQRRNQAEGAALVEDLVQKGADPNGYRYNNPIAFRWRAPFKLPTPLHVACQEANVPVARALLQLGADPHQMMLEAGELSGQTALELALVSNDRELVDIFTAGSDH